MIPLSDRDSGMVALRRDSGMVALTVRPDGFEFTAASEPDASAVLGARHPPPGSDPAARQLRASRTRRDQTPTDYAPNLVCDSSSAARPARR
jgi:hypothetical protein